VAAVLAAHGGNVAAAAEQMGLSRFGLEKVIPSEFMLHAHHWLILHGRYVCQARQPQCWQCRVSAQCDFEPKTPPP